MTAWFVSRHPGAIAWIKRQAISIDQFEPHLDIDEVKKNDIVYGTLPVNLAWKVTIRGARYLHLTLNVPENWRGHELTDKQLDKLQAKLEEFKIERVLVVDTRES
ncbi:CRISPR-associated protein Csx16 [Vibrio chaetopteri]|uniref:CRISPR-associated protein Csx16 n=1 Tax=Vibrio chaetopteri TaxID=3016528 RepID=UPI003AB792EB